MYSRQCGEHGDCGKKNEKNYYTHIGVKIEAPAMKTKVFLGALNPYLTLPYRINGSINQQKRQTTVP